MGIKVGYVPQKAGPAESWAFETKLPWHFSAHKNAHLGPQTLLQLPRGMDAHKLANLPFHNRNRVGNRGTTLPRGLFAEGFSMLFAGSHTSASSCSEHLPLSTPKLTTAPSESPPLEELTRKYGVGRACHQKQERTFSRCLVFGLGNTKWTHWRIGVWPNGLRWFQKETESFSFKWTMQFIKPFEVGLRTVTKTDSSVRTRCEMDPCPLCFPLLLPERITILNSALTILFFLCTHGSVSKQYEDAGLFRRMYLTCLPMTLCFAACFWDLLRADRSTTISRHGGPLFPIYETTGPPYWPWVFITDLLKHSPQSYRPITITQKKTLNR